MREKWHKYWLLRWVIVTTLGGTISLLLSALFVWLTGGFGALLSGAIIGAGLGIGQAWILFTLEENDFRKQWILYSACGGFFGMFPAFFLSVTSIFSVWLGAFLIGFAFAGLLGFLQSFILVKLLGERAFLWIVMCLFAGGLSAMLSVPILQTRIPLLCSPTLPVFALLTGWLLVRWMQEK